MLKQTREYKTGVTVELKFQAWLAPRVASVVRVRHGGEFAPTLTTWAWNEEHRLILPDLQVTWRDGQYCWCEVKEKETCGEYIVAGLRTTGVNLNKYADYKEVESRSRHPVYVVFAHHEQNEVRVAEPQHKWFRGAGNGGDMMYLDYDKLPILCAFNELWASRAVRPVIDEPVFWPPRQMPPVQLAF